MKYDLAVIAADDGGSKVPWNLDPELANYIDVDLQITLTVTFAA